MRIGRMLSLGLMILTVGSAWAQVPSRRVASLGSGLSFSEVSAEAGVAFVHALPEDQPVFETLRMHSGVAAGDLDADGFPDLIAVRGPEAGNGIYRNRGDGTFEDITQGSALQLLGAYTNGVSFADVDNDGDLDVFFGGLVGNAPRLFRNLGEMVFENVTLESGLVSSEVTFSAAFSDIDGDEDLDVFLAHWSGVTGQVPAANHLWRNDGTGIFTPIDAMAGLAPLFELTDWSFTPNFVDLDRDGDSDLVLATDFGGSAVLRNQGGGVFDIVTDDVITDENGMGATVGDFDGDGIWDWFVSSIWDPNGASEGNWGISGNRLYRGLGDGTFEDVTAASGVREGFWGWGSCAADFDLDLDLDIYHVNGFPVFLASEFLEDPARLFLNDGTGVFIQNAEALGVADTGQGRAIVCFDYDLDGDIDIFVNNNRGPSRLFRNNLLNGARLEGGRLNGDLLESGGQISDRRGSAAAGPTSPSWLAIDLRRQGGNSFAVGSEVRALVAGRELVRQVQAGNNYLSQNPLRLHFGLGENSVVDELEIRWPDGEVERLTNVVGGQTLLIRQGGPLTVEVPALGRQGIVLLMLILGGLSLRMMRRS